MPGTDARFYIELGYSYRSQGFLSGLGTIRTYGYPLFTWGYVFLGGIDVLRVALYGGIIQLALYAVSALWLASRFSGTTSIAILAGLLLNPIVVGLVADMLTEAPSLILTVLAIGLLVEVTHARSPLVWAAVGALVTNFSLMIRPANLILVIAWNIGILVTVRARELMGYAAVWSATGVIAWAPQVIHNLSVGSTVIPILDGQIKWGIVLAKYASIINSQGLAQPYLFINPWCSDLARELSPWLWYLKHPLHGALTAIGHIMGAFTFEHFTTYVYELTPSYLLAGTMWAVCALGALEGLAVLRRHYRLPEIVVVAALFVLSLGVLAFVVPENRFAAIPLAVLSVAAAGSLHKVRWPLLAIAFLAGLLGAMFAEKLARTGVPFPEAGIGYRCDLTNFPAQK